MFLCARARKTRRSWCAPAQIIILQALLSDALEATSPAALYFSEKSIFTTTIRQIRPFPIPGPAQTVRKIHLRTCRFALKARVIFVLQEHLTARQIRAFC